MIESLSRLDLSKTAYAFLDTYNMTVYRFGKLLTYNKIIRMASHYKDRFKLMCNSELICYSLLLECINKVESLKKNIINFLKTKRHPDTFCACGCGESIKFSAKSWYWKRFPKYKTGHNRRGTKFTDEQCKYLKLLKIGKENPAKRPDVREKISKNRTGIRHTQETINKLRQYTGAKASNWKGGISFLDYPQEFSYSFKKQIRARDNRRCCFCGANATKLHCHHINRDKTDNNPLNLITLCSRCHGRAHSKYALIWQAYYTAKILQYNQKELGNG